MTGTRRLSASVDAELVGLAHAAVEEGRAESVSAWVNDARRLKAEHENRMEALDAFLAEYEAEHGQITDSEIDHAVRQTRGRATVVRSSGSDGPLPRRG